jgi:hypothetical protein
MAADASDWTIGLLLAFWVPDFVSFFFIDSAGKEIEWKLSLTNR